MPYLTFHWVLIKLRSMSVLNKLRCNIRKDIAYYFFCIREGGGGVSPSDYALSHFPLGAYKLRSMSVLNKLRCNIRKDIAYYFFVYMMDFFKRSTVGLSLTNKLKWRLSQVVHKHVLPTTNVRAITLFTVVGIMNILRTFLSQLWS